MGQMMLWNLMFPSIANLPLCTHKAKPNSNSDSKDYIYFKYITHIEKHTTVCSDFKVDTGTKWVYV